MSKHIKFITYSHTINTQNVQSIQFTIISIIIPLRVNQISLQHMKFWNEFCVCTPCMPATDLTLQMYRTTIFPIYWYNRPTACHSYGKRMQKSHGPFVSIELILVYPPRYFSIQSRIYYISLITE